MAILLEINFKIVQCITLHLMLILHTKIIDFKALCMIKTEKSTKDLLQNVRSNDISWIFLCQGCSHLTGFEWWLVIVRGIINQNAKSLVSLIIELWTKNSNIFANPYPEIWGIHKVPKVICIYFISNNIIYNFLKFYSISVNEFYFISILYLQNI